MKKILCICLMAVSFFACDKDPEVVIPQSHAGRTVLAFLWANNNLNDDLRANIRNMMTGLQDMKEEATLLVYWDGKENTSDSDWQTPVIVRYTTNGQGGINGYSRDELDELSSSELVKVGEIEKEYPSQISTKKQVMQTVISDMMACCPSESYGIIFGSHGSGWLPTITGTRSIGVDGSNANTAVVPELAEVLRTANPQKFDFVMFDACMMGCAEVYYELKDATRYCLASVLDIPAAGIPYAEIMPYLYAEDFKNCLQTICKDYIDYYNYRAWGTISAVDCSRMDGLAQEFRRVIVSNQEELKEVETTGLQQYGRAGNGFKGYAYDMLQYVRHLCGGTVPQDFLSQFNETVLYTGYVSDIATNASIYRIDGENYCGMGMYIPNAYTDAKSTLWNNYFKSSIAWYQAAGWAETESIWGN